MEQGKTVIPEFDFIGLQEKFMRLPEHSKVKIFNTLEVIMDVAVLSAQIAGCCPENDRVAS